MEELIISFNAFYLFILVSLHRLRFSIYLRVKCIPSYLYRILLFLYILALINHTSVHSLTCIKLAHCSTIVLSLSLHVFHIKFILWSPMRLFLVNREILLVVITSYWFMSVLLYSGSNWGRLIRWYWLVMELLIHLAWFHNSTIL